MLEHSSLLRRENLAAKCQTCSVVEICGGGSVPHRYAENGFLNPTVYCQEMFALISHVRKRVMQQLDDEINTNQINLKSITSITVDVTAFESPLTSSTIIDNLLELWTIDALCIFESVLKAVLQKEPQKQHLISKILSCKPEFLNRLVLNPSVVLWTTVMQQASHGIIMRSIDGEPILPDINYLEVIASRCLQSSIESAPHIYRYRPNIKQD